MAIILAWMLLTYAQSTETIICTQNGGYDCQVYTGEDYEAYYYEDTYLEGQIGYTQSEGFNDLPSVDTVEEEPVKTYIYNPLDFLIWRK